MLRRREGLTGGVGGFFQRPYVEVDARAPNGAERPLESAPTARREDFAPAVQALFEQATPFADALAAAARDVPPTDDFFSATVAEDQPTRGAARRARTVSRRTSSSPRPGVRAPRACTARSPTRDAIRRAAPTPPPVPDSGPAARAGAEAHAEPIILPPPEPEPDAQRPSRSRQPDAAATPARCPTAEPELEVEPEPEPEPKPMFDAPLGLRHPARADARPRPRAAAPDRPAAAADAAEQRLVAAGLSQALAADIVREAVAHGLPFSVAAQHQEADPRPSLARRIPCSRTSSPARARSPWSAAAAPARRRRSPTSPRPTPPRVPMSRSSRCAATACSPAACSRSASRPRGRGRRAGQAAPRRPPAAGDADRHARRRSEPRCRPRQGARRRPARARSVRDPPRAAGARSAPPPRPRLAAALAATIVADAPVLPASRTPTRPPTPWRSAGDAHRALARRRDQAARRDRARAAGGRRSYVCSREGATARRPRRAGAAAASLMRTMPLPSHPRPRPARVVRNVHVGMLPATVERSDASTVTVALAVKDDRITRLVGHELAVEAISGRGIHRFGGVLSAQNAGVLTITLSGDVERIQRREYVRIAAHLDVTVQGHRRADRRRDVDARRQRQRHPDHRQVAAAARPRRARRAQAPGRPAAVRARPRRARRLGGGSEGHPARRCRPRRRGSPDALHPRP